MEASAEAVKEHNILTVATSAILFAAEAAITIEQ